MDERPLCIHFPWPPGPGGTETHTHTHTHTYTHTHTHTHTHTYTQKSHISIHFPPLPATLKGIWGNPDATTDFVGWLAARSHSFESSLGYCLGFYAFEVLMIGLFSLLKIPRDNTNTHQKILSVFSIAVALGFGQGEFLACGVMTLEVASPVLKVCIGALMRLR